MIAPNRQKLRVMHVLHSLHAGGAERIVCDLARERAGELELVIVCLDGFGQLAPEARASGATVHCTGRREGLDPAQITRIAALIQRTRPDIIHAHHYTPYLYAALAASCVGFGRILYTEHGRHYPDEVSTPRRAVNQILRLRRDRVTAVCRFVADALRHNERIASRNVRIIPNGVRCDLLRRPRRRRWLAGLLGVDPQEPFLIQVARFHPVKDHATSVQAFAQARRSYGPANLVLVGDGPEAPAIRRLARKLGVQGSVHLLGLRDDVPNLLAASDVFVLSSLSEAASLSILEAMAAGLPVAATDVGGNGEIVVHGRTGLLSPRGNPEAMAKNLLRMLENPRQRLEMGRAGKERAETLYDQRRMHDSFVQLYHEMAQEARCLA